MATIESAATIGIPSSIGSAGSPRQGITVHYVGGSQVSHGAHTNCRAQVRNWHNYHRSLGWQGLGYHYCVCPHGIVLTGRGLNRVGSHSPGVNATRVGVLFMVGGSQQPTANMLKAFRELRVWLSARGVNSNSITGHQAHVSTSCPGAPLMSRVRSGNWGTGGSTTPPPSGGGGTTPTTEGDEEMLGLKEGDTGPRVEALQTSLRHAGFGDLLGTYGPRKDGVDGQYGPGTSKAVLAARKYVNSGATSGKTITGSAAAQIRRAVARREAQAAANAAK